MKFYRRMACALIVTALSSAGLQAFPNMQQYPHQEIVHEEEEELTFVSRMEDALLFQRVYGKDGVEYSARCPITGYWITISQRGDHPVCVLGKEEQETESAHGYERIMIDGEPAVYFHFDDGRNVGRLMVMYFDDGDVLGLWQTWPNA